MISIQVAAAFLTLFLVSAGILHIRMLQKNKRMKTLEKLLADAGRELNSLEMLKSRFLGRIGDVLSEPLRAIENTSEKLGRENPNLPPDVLRDLSRLAEEVHALTRILTVFEEISRDEGEDPSRSMERIQLDDIVAEAAMNISEAASGMMVSVSVNICGPVSCTGSRNQLSEAVNSLLRETLRRAGESAVISMELRESRNIELEISWSSNVSGTDTGQKEENLLGTGLSRLIASAHGGWVSEDNNEGRITLILPKAGEQE